MPFPPTTFGSVEEYKESFIQDLPRLNCYVRATGTEERFLSALEEVGFTLDGFALSSSEDSNVTILPASAVIDKTPFEIYRLCFTYWRNLPDNRSIHQPFFGKLCDYCSEWNTWGDESCETTEEAEENGFDPVEAV